ncbi:putative mediator of RNA polymerase II transcription subunit 26c [Senna tora]|uniref:Putative mediator of RNA polymerase II transcription subunit 26c n=1 Tax=Senna tora TaxID=362788 RepID=A0A835CI77_9FABA|nr:putative mediator of RNA polymerase II transcription subunit 26c [Senna tora]
MDLDDFRSILETAGVDVWMFIDTAIDVASMDYGKELKHRRDGIVQRLYGATSDPPARCRNCDGTSAPIKKQSTPELKLGASPATPHSIGQDDDDLDPYGGLLDDEQRKIHEIKEQLEDPDQSEDSKVELLQNLADMDITFQALKETNIGWHVNRLRKHSSNDVKRLVKLLVRTNLFLNRKWKEIVDEWVKINPPGDHASIMADGDSPQQKNPQNGHHQIPDFAYSPNPHNGSSGSERNYSELEPKQKTVPPRKQLATPKPATPVPIPASAPQNRGLLQQEDGFKKTTKKLKMVELPYPS